MNKRKKQMIEGWLDKASTQRQVARNHQKAYSQVSEAIERAQECIELSVKSITSMLGIKYLRVHGLDTRKKDFAEVAAQIERRQLPDRLEEVGLANSVRLGRLLFLLSFWAQFYEVAKYGIESGNLGSAKDIFDKEEADLAIKHADECHRAANELRYLPEEKLATLLLGDRDSSDGDTQ